MTNMYTKDLKHKMTLRLNDELKEYVDEMANKFMISPSDFIRQCVAQNLEARKMTQNIVMKFAQESPKELKEGLENGIDRKTDLNNLV